MNTHSKRGRPRSRNRMTGAAFDLPKALLAEIDAICRQRLDKPSRSQVIRELIVAGIETHRQKEAQKELTT